MCSIDQGCFCLPCADVDYQWECRPECSFIPNTDEVYFLVLPEDLKANIALIYQANEMWNVIGCTKTLSFVLPFSNGRITEYILSNTEADRAVSFYAFIILKNTITVWLPGFYNFLRIFIRFNRKTLWQQLKWQCCIFQMYSIYVNALIHFPHITVNSAVFLTI